MFAELVAYETRGLATGGTTSLLPETSEQPTSPTVDLAARRVRRSDLPLMSIA